MRRIALTVFVLLIGLAAGQGVNPERYARNKAAMTPHQHSTKSLVVHNDYIAVQLDDSPSGEYGRFNIGTWPDNRTLTYAYPSDPWSSWVIVRVDGNSYVAPGGGPDCDQLEPLSSAPFDIYSWPTDPDSNYIYGGWYVPDHPDISVYQTLQPVYLVYPDDTTGTIFIKYRIVNNDTECHWIGVLLQLDTMIGDNDAAPLSTILGYSGIEEDFWNCDTCEFPCYWFAYEDPAGPAGDPDQLIAMGILCGFDATPPDRFAVGAWSTFYDVTWDLTPSHSDYWDSAVLIWWYPVEVCPGETLEVATYYGLGKPVAGNLVIQIPEYPRVEDCWYEPDTFVVQTSFTNGLGTVLHDCQATIDLPEGLSLAPGYEATRILSPSNLASGGTGNTGWEVVINHAPAEDESICVYVTSPSYDTVFTRCEPFTLPEVLRPSAEIAEPLPMTVSACPEQQLVLNVNFPNGYENLQFMVDGETVDPSEISVVDDTLLVYTPAEPWDNGTHTFGLVHMDDALGCELDSVLATFDVDVAPPVVSNEFPSADTILGNPAFGNITVNIQDAERTVDPASIVFAVNGDTFTVDDSILTYDGTTLTFNPAAAGMEFSDGDTVCCAVVDAADDSVDYCEPNHIPEPYEWCFSINIVDIALPDTFGHAGDVVNIPIYTEDLARLGVTSFDITISYFPSVLTPVDIIQTGTTIESWGDVSMDIPDPGVLHITGSGSAATSSDVLCYIQFVVGPHMGTYSRLDFVDATFNDGSLVSNTNNGFFTVLWDPVQWSGTIFFFAKNMPVHHLTFGASATATDGYDPDIDLIHTPPTISDIDAWFNLDDPAYPSITRLNRDFRNSSDTDIVWTGEATFSTVGETVWVYWNPSSLPDGLFLLTYTTPEGEITLDMKSDTTFYFFDSTHFEIRFLRGELEHRTVEVCPGWNLLSLPVLPTGATPIREIIPGALTDGYWYNPLFHGYDVVVTPAAGKAFWVFTLENGEVPLAGMNVPTVGVHLYRGWNMVGMPYDSAGYVLVSELSTVPDGAVLTSGIFGYDACESHGYYPVSETLYIGKGYWIYATEECDLTIGGSLLRADATPRFEQQITLRADGYPLILASDSRASAGIDEYDIPVPPPTPEGETSIPAVIVDGRRFIRSVSPAGEFEIQVQPGMVLSWNPDEIPAGIDAVLYDGNTRVDMKTVSSWQAQNALLKVEFSSLPEKIALLPNKPNPFNASTTIEFALPQTAEVKIEIYDLYGHKIRTLFDGSAHAGVNKITWHGDDDRGSTVSSGVYFVRMTADGKEFVRKITLIK